MKNQLFKTIPDLNVIMELLSYFGIDSLTNDDQEFNIQTMDDLNTVQEILENIDTIKSYYIPCKVKLYLSELTNKKCITVLRQFLKAIGYTLIYKEKYKNGVKYINYKITQLNREINIENKSSEKIVISFD